MNSMIVLSALLGLALAVPQQQIIVDDGLVGLGGHGLGLSDSIALSGHGSGLGLSDSIALSGHGSGLGLVESAPVLSHGVSSYSSRVVHPSIHGGLVRSWGGPAVLSHGIAAPTIVRSWGAPSGIRSWGAPSVVRSSVLSHGPVLSSRIVGPSVLSHGVVGPTVLSSGHDLGLGWSGKGY